jgi:hypothetical protein
VSEDSIVRRGLPLTVEQAARLWTWVADVERLEALTNHQIAERECVWHEIPLSLQLRERWSWQI